MFPFLCSALLCLNPATITSVLFAVSVPTLTFTPPKQLPPPSYTPSLTAITPLYYGLPKYQINCLQHIQKFLARTVVQAPKFQHITPILKSLHWLKVSEWIEYKIMSLAKLSIPLSHYISMTFSLLMVTTHGHSYQTTIKPSKSLTAPSDMLRLIFGTSFLHHSGFLIQIIHSRLSDLHLNMPV